MPWTDAAFRFRSRAAPTVYVSDDKHGNYRNVSECHFAHGNNNLHDWEDWCGQGTGIRFPVYDYRNAGSRFVDLRGCVASEKYPASGRTECFYYNRGDGFQGWSASRTGDPIASYHRMLFAEYNFEYYRSESGSTVYTHY